MFPNKLQNIKDNQTLIVALYRDKGELKESSCIIESKDEELLSKAMKYLLREYKDAIVVLIDNKSFDFQ